MKIGDWKTHAFNKTGLFRGVSQLLLSMIVVYLNYQKKLFYVPYLCCLNMYTCTVQAVYVLYLLESTIFIITYAITLLNGGFGGGMLFVCIFCFFLFLMAVSVEVMALYQDNATNCFAFLMFLREIDNLNALSASFHNETTN